MDEQQALDNETKAARYDRITACQARVEELEALEAQLVAKLRMTRLDLRRARWDLGLVMSPVRKGVRG